MKKWVIAIVVLAALAILYFTYNPAESELFPKCPFYALTGLKCPGCGSQRAIHYLFNGNIRGAFLVHPLLVLAIPYLLLAVYFEYMGGKSKYPLIRKRLFGVKACIIIFVIVLAYWILRNIFGW
ncbi:MAG: DUF2752 domain-containing protein [Prevotellaceae bacterium]|jgi:hypothetical protein|nr:DUF2752 domain-containing protein [Prevotellaceae bacterium]